MIQSFIEHRYIKNITFFNNVLCVLVILIMLFLYATLYHPYNQIRERVQLFSISYIMYTLIIIIICLPTVDYTCILFQIDKL